MTQTPSDAEADATDDDVVISMDDVEVHFDQASEGLIESMSPWRDTSTVHAVDGVDLDIHEREVIALVGESGCGKTTLGKTAVGLQRPTGGTVSYHGQDVWKARDGDGNVEIPFQDIRRALQIIHQDPGSSLNPNRKVRKTLGAVISRWNPKLDRNDIVARIHGMLERVGITPAEDYAERYPHQLSGGEQQRIALIRALLMNPDVILADESISALDVSLRIEMMDLFLEIQDLYDTSYVFISHDLSNARYIVEKAGGRIAIMYLGEIVEIGTVDEVINNPTHPYTKALRWATPHLDPEVMEAQGDMPVRKIDIPDAVNPPSGCRFHTRCPEAREVCAEQHPGLIETEGSEAACYRADENHEYWDSDSIADESSVSISGSTDGEEGTAD